MEDDHARVDDGLSELRAATSVEQLHRRLVTRRVRRSSTRHQEAVELFEHHHGADPGGAVDTAVLLCTEPRWERCTAKLIVGIRATGILDDLALDELADRLLWPDPPRVRHPLSWLGREWTGLEFRDPTVDDLRSPTRPPLLRWAAGHLLLGCSGRVVRGRGRVGTGFEVIQHHVHRSSTDGHSVVVRVEPSRRSPVRPERDHGPRVDVDHTGPCRSSAARPSSGAIFAMDREPNEDMMRELTEITQAEAVGSMSDDD